jgi:hypothetical protein
LQSMAAVARHAVVVNDLVRSRLHYYAARLLLAVMACHPVTRHDGSLSVLRAYSVGVREMVRLGDYAGAHCRQWAIGSCVCEPPTEKAALDGLDGLVVEDQHHCRNAPSTSGMASSMSIMGISSRMG